MSEYYFDVQKTYEIYGGRIGLKKLKEHVALLAAPIRTDLSKNMSKNIYCYWARRDTFGFVFTDFEFLPVGHERLIGKGEKELFEKIKDDFHFLLLSKTLDRNFKQVKVGELEGVLINLNYFKEFLSIIRNRKKTVGLFLQKLSKEEETLIRNWLRSYEKFEEVKEKALITDIDSIVDVLRKYEIESPADLEKIIIVSKESAKKIPQQWEYFEPRLQEFKKLIDDQRRSEDELRGFLYENIWLIDFSFLRYHKKEEEHTAIGDIDISLYKDDMGIQRVFVVELKKSSQKIVTDKYRGKRKPVILAEVGKALSQAMHYMEELKQKHRTIRGIVIVGRKEEVKDWFIDKFNEYLHGIDVLTYDELYERAKLIVDMFKGNEVSNITKEESPQA